MNDTASVPDPPLDAGTTAERMRAGARYVLTGGRFLRAHPDLAIWALVPAIVQLVLLVLAAWVCLVWLPAWMATGWAPTQPPMVHVYNGLVYTAALAALFAMSIGIYLASGLIGAPFYDRLSADVETLILGPDAAEADWREVATTIGMSVAHSGLALVLWVVCQLLFTLFNAVPVLGGLVELGSGITVSSLFLARELMDGSLSRRRMGFRHKVRTMLAQPALLGGFGAAAGAVLWIPVVNTLTMPACVIGATLLVCDLERQGLIPAADARAGGDPPGPAPAPPAPAG
ncbi:MAG: CysZ protein [Myxococcota bacterium]|jgi:CysZ protein